MCDLYGDSFAKYNDDNYQAYVQLWEDHFQKQASSSSATPPGSSGGTAQMEGLESLSAVLPVVHPAGQRKRKGLESEMPSFPDSLGFIRTTHLLSKCWNATQKARQYFTHTGPQKNQPLA